jgi:hypothetical protein
MGSGRAAKCLNLHCAIPFVVSVSNHERIFSQLPRAKRDPSRTHWTKVQYLSFITFRYKSYENSRNRELSELREVKNKRNAKFKRGVTTWI